MTLVFCTHSETFQNFKIFTTTPKYFPWKQWNSNPTWSIATGDYEGWQTIQLVGPEWVSRKLHFQCSTGAVFSNGCMDWAERLRGWSLVWHNDADVSQMARISKRGRCFWVIFSFHVGRILLGPDVIQPYSTHYPARALSFTFEWTRSPSSRRSLKAFLRPPSARFGWDLWLDFSQRNSAFLKETCIPSIFEESLYHQVDLTNMSGSRRWKGGK